MTRKNKISIAVVVVCLGAAAFILVNHFSGGSYSTSVSDLIQSPTISADQPANILPYGSQLNFKPIKDYDEQAAPFTYPVLSPGTVGIPPDQLLKGPPGETARGTNP